MEWIKVTGLFLVICFLLINIIFLFRKYESFFNLRDIVKDHLYLFHDCKSQYIVFYFSPLLFAVGLALLYEAGETFYTNLSVIVSVLLSMLLAILSILAGKDYSFIADNNQRENIQNVTQETITAIVFDSLLCIFLLLYGLAMVVIDGINFDTDIVKRVLAGVAYYTFAVTLLNLLLIVKRMSRIIEFDFHVQKEKRK